MNLQYNYAAPATIPTHTDYLAPSMRNDISSRLPSKSSSPHQVQPTYHQPQPSSQAGPSHQVLSSSYWARSSSYT